MIPVDGNNSDPVEVSIMLALHPRVVDVVWEVVAPLLPS
jgi:hypothetical protein